MKFQVQCMHAWKLKQLRYESDFHNDICADLANFFTLSTHNLLHSLYS